MSALPAARRARRAGHRAARTSSASTGVGEDIVVRALRRRLAAHRARRVRRDHGQLGQRQEHADAHPRLPRRADRRAATCSTASTCATSTRTTSPTCATARSASSSRLQPRPAHERAGQRRAAARLRGPGRARPPRARASAALDAVGMADRAAPPAVRALRRPAAARRRRAGDRHQPRDDPRRRADRQPRLALDRTRCSTSSTRLNDAGRTVVLITHEDDVAARARRVDPARRRRGSPTPTAIAGGRVTPVEILRIALAGVAANKLRSGLTILGMTIGVAAVIILVAVGNGSKHAGPGAHQRARLQRAARAGRRAGGFGPGRRRRRRRDASRPRTPTRSQDAFNAPDVKTRLARSSTRPARRSSPARRATQPSIVRRHRRPPTRTTRDYEIAERRDVHRRTTSSSTGASSCSARPSSQNLFSRRRPGRPDVRVDGTALPGRRRDRVQGLQRHPGPGRRRARAADRGPGRAHRLRRAGSARSRSRPTSAARSTPRRPRSPRS